MSFSCSAILGFQFVVEVQRVLGLQVEAQAWAGPSLLALWLVQLEQEHVEPKGL